MSETENSVQFVEINPSVTFLSSGSQEIVCWVVVDIYIYIYSSSISPCRDISPFGDISPSKYISPCRDISTYSRDISLSRYVSPCRNISTSRDISPCRDILLIEIYLML